MVTAVYTIHGQKAYHSAKDATHLTDAVSHAEMPTCFLAASSANLLYTEAICLVAGSVSGLACAALMRAFNGPDSFDISASDRVQVQTSRRFVQVV